MATDEVVFQTEDALGRVVLNRPRAINALTYPMVDAIDAQLAAWADDARIEVVSIEGAGERGLCAGGDVVAVRQAVIDKEQGPVPDMGGNGLQLRWTKLGPGSLSPALSGRIRTLSNQSQSKGRGHASGSGSSSSSSSELRFRFRSAQSGQSEQ